MDHSKILKRAFEITKIYRALWIFGIIVALTTTSGSSVASGGGAGGRGGNGNHDNEQSTSFPAITLTSEGTWNEFESFVQDLDAPTPSEFWTQLGEALTDLTKLDPDLGTWLAIGIALACLVLLLIVLFVIGRYVAVTALIKMVDAYEADEKKLTVRQGFKLGWSREAWRIFLIDLLLRLPLALAIVLTLLLSLAPLLLLISGEIVAGIAGAVASAGLFFLVIFFAIIAGAIISLLERFAHRACILQKVGVFEAVRQGYRLIRQNLKDIGIMWLLMIGISLAWPLLLLPLGFLLLVAAIGVGGLLGITIGGLAALAFGTPAGWIIGGVGGGLLFFIVLVAPLLFLNGLYETFTSTTWTLTYRETRALQEVSTMAPALNPALEEE